MTKTIALLVAIVCAAACHRDDDGLVRMAHRARAQHEGMSSAIPILRVDNLKKAQRYYRDALGFKVMWEDGDPPDFGAVKRDDAVFFMCQRCQGSTPSWSFVFVDDVDKLYRELKERHANIARAPRQEPWGLREMHVVDEDGNVIRFAGEGDHD